MLLGVCCGFAAAPAFGDAGHARIIRLSLVQGDVRFTRDVRGDALTSSKNLWENAVLNLPIREGYVLSTDHGRAVVEFENGAMAFLNEGTVVEFYDLSVENGARTTRLILRQGGVSLYIGSRNADYFSVTGGDFTAEATSRAAFRLDNFDDGSVVNVSAGHVSVIRKERTTEVGKGESFSVAAVSGRVNLESLPQKDDFDRWVEAHIESAVAATNAGSQYAGNSGYLSGFGDLYTYGSWLPLGNGYGYGWQPFGAGLGWSPFGYGGWFADSGFGWGFIGNQPWGWLPYHFGGWLFRPALGWVWVPGNFGNVGGTTWRPATVSWVHVKSGPVGFALAHPSDVPGKSAGNLAQGVFTVSNGVVSREAVQSSAEWKAEKAPPRDALSSSLHGSAAPALISRSMLTGASSGRASGVVFDASEHRFLTTAANELQRSTAPGKIPEASTAVGRTGNPSVASQLAAARRSAGVVTRPPLVPAPSIAQRSGQSPAIWGATRGAASGPVVPSTASPARSSAAPGGGRAH
jgi:hypothetical protein